jgi:phytoene dehydrogenase-like protein
VEDGKAKGIELEDGRKIMANKAIVSTLNPHQTFLELVGEDNVPSDLAQSIKDWKWEDWSLFTIHLGLKGLPSYKAGEEDPDCNRALIQLLGYESVEDVISHWKECIDGKLPSAKGHITSISQFDPIQAPKGYHVARFETQAPYEVSGRDWEDIKEQYADECLKTWESHLANRSELKVVKEYIYPPTYIEQKLVDMVRGSIKQGAYISTQMGFFRPNIECSNYRTPIEGLYIAGASVYPGGMITLGPGYNAAAVVAKDLGLRIWWTPPDNVIRAQEKNLVPKWE